MAAHQGLDREVERPNVDAQMTASGDLHRPRAFRNQARVWSPTDFESYIDDHAQGSDLPV